MSFTYNRGVWRGLDHFECVVCSYDSCNEANMLEHCAATKHGLTAVSQASIDDFVRSQAPLEHRGVMITLGLLCWNTAKVSLDSLDALRQEAERLYRLGCHASIAVVDNGSDDGTNKLLADYADNCKGREWSWAFCHNRVNLGISRARNQLISLARGSEFMLMMDGDIEVVPLSTYTMLRYLKCHPEVGCIGAYASNCSTNRDMVAPMLVEIPESHIRADIKVAWTQYGLFRSRMFSDGIKFDEGGAFREPGWGFEDDDLCLQMIEKGWGNRYFGGMCYLHRNLRSSHSSLVKSGVDLVAMFNKRKDYLLNKWSKRDIDAGILNSIRGQQLPGHSNG